MKYLDYDGLQEFKSNLDLKYEEKVEGKGLSTNDFTAALKNKLDNIEEGATANEGTVTGITIGQTDYIPIDGLITLPDYPTTFGASGTNHSSGLVPDPGATQGNSKFLREDGTWQTPPDNNTWRPVSDSVSSTSSSDAASSKAVKTAYDLAASKTANTGTVTSVAIKMNGATKGTVTTSGTIDLGTVLTSHQDISGKADKTTTINGHALSSNVTVTKSDVGLGNVTNDAQVKRSEMGAASGVATLDSAGKVPSSQLPSYVDDVLEYDTKSDFPTTGEAGKIYVNKATNTTWRWSGSAYTQIKGDLAIGITTGTAADGGVANTHYNNTSNPHSVTKAQVGLGSVVNTGDSATPVSGGTTKFTTGGAYTELNKKVDKVDGKGLSTNDYTTNEKNKLAGIAAGATNVTTDTVSGWGYTKNAGTITGIKMNGASKGTSGVVDLGTVITAHQDISGKVDKTITVNGHALSGNISVTKSDVGLGNVGNFKAVSTEASQGLTDTEKSNARANIGAGTSSFSGSYNDLLNKPSIPAAAANGTYTVKTLVGSTTTNVSDFTANQSSADDVTFVQGSNVTITPDATNRKITIAATDTTYSEATTSAAGLMSSSDKGKLNGIESGAQTHKAPTTAEVKSALGTGSGTSKYLREDGTWQTPPTVTESTVSGWGFTKNSGTVVGAKIGANGSTISPNSNGILNLPENSLVLSDWEEDDTTADSYILNKPTIITEQQVLNLFDGGLTPGEDVEFVTLDDLETEVENAGFIKSEDLATVATSGSYNDLINKPNFARIEDITLGYTETTTGITNLDATLLSTALRKTAQTLTPTEQALVKLNLGITEYSASLTRNIIISTSEPTSSDGNDGDIWLVYES